MAGSKLSAVVVISICFVIFVSKSESGHCNSGQTVHILPNGSARCCIPWPYTCPINYPYTICDKDGGPDVCRKCPSGSIQPNLSNSTHPKSCFKNRPICSEDKVPLNRVEMLRGVRPSCICDRANNYFPIMGGIGCDFKPRGCPKGKELQVNGTCGECLLGTYKDWGGFGLCKPWTNCESKRLSLKLNGTTSTDAKCEKQSKVISKHVTSVMPMNRTLGE
ncbi:tumor necrosis factor receptor superfamily member 9-like [Liolophura sinensis]|uniref:tumor necrosis factor receptor superfamily member 9-like n=1 Tax=Liolophura sinensis TaxID=3198878 RepID=UPI003157F70B